MSDAAMAKMRLASSTCGARSSSAKSRRSSARASLARRAACRLGSRRPRQGSAQAASRLPAAAERGHQLLFRGLANHWQHIRAAKRGTAADHSPLPSSRQTPGRPSAPSSCREAGPCRTRHFLPAPAHAVRQECATAPRAMTAPCGGVLQTWFFRCRGGCDTCRKAETAHAGITSSIPVRTSSATSSWRVMASATSRPPGALALARAAGPRGP